MAAKQKSDAPEKLFSEPLLSDSLLLFQSAREARDREPFIAAAKSARLMEVAGNLGADKAALRLASATERLLQLAIRRTDATSWRK